MRHNSSDEEYSELLQCAAQSKERNRRIFDPVAIENILAKLNKRHWRPSLDREALAQGLERALSMYEISKGFDRRPPKKQLQKICKLIPRLRKILPCPDGIRDDSLAQALCDAGFGIDALRAVATNLPVLLDAAEAALVRLDELASSPEARELNASKWLIGWKLPEIFQRYFKSKPRGISRSPGGNSPSGPAIDFVLEVLSIAQIYSSKGTPYTAAGVEDIFQTCRSQNIGERSPKKDPPPILTE